MVCGETVRRNIVNEPGMSAKGSLVLDVRQWSRKLGILLLLALSDDCLYTTRKLILGVEHTLEVGEGSVGCPDIRAAKVFLGSWNVPGVARNRREAETIITGSILY